MVPGDRGLERCGATGRLPLVILRAVCKSKIHRAIVTRADLHYVGSVAIDAELLAHTDIVPGEQVCVWNVNNGERVETYAIAAPAGSGDVVLNGAAARLFQPGDVVIITAFCLTDEAIVPRMIAVDEHNRFSAWLSAPPHGEPLGEEVARRDPASAGARRH
jgi:aspartate 1-decarboxylase